MKKILCILLIFLLALQVFAQEKPTQKKQEQTNQQLKTAQGKNAHSKEPMSFMGFTYTTKKKDIEAQLKEWDIQWNILENGGIQIRDIDWKGINFQVINFLFDKKDKIQWIYCSPSKEEERDNVLTCFKDLVTELPYRDNYVKKSNHPLLSDKEYILWNGKDETEFAVADVYGTYLSLHFYFNNSIKECLGIKP